MCIPERTSRCPEGGIETRTGWRGCSNNTKWEGVCTCDHTGPRVSITRASSWALHIQHLETLKGMNYCPRPLPPAFSPKSRGSGRLAHPSVLLVQHLPGCCRPAVAHVDPSRLSAASSAILSATSSSGRSSHGPGSGITSTNSTPSCRCLGPTWGPCTTTVPWSAQVRRRQHRHPSASCRAQGRAEQRWRLFLGEPPGFGASLFTVVALVSHCPHLHLPALRVDWAA